MGIFSFILLAISAYLAWRVADQIPDIIFRMSEIQRDVAELRRMQLESTDTPKAKATPAKRTRKASAPKAGNHATAKPAADASEKPSD